MCGLVEIKHFSFFVSYQSVSNLNCTRYLCERELSQGNSNGDNILLGTPTGNILYLNSTLRGSQHNMIVINN